MMFDIRLRPPRIFFHQPDAIECASGFGSHFRIPYVNTSENLQWLSSRNQSIYGAAFTSHATGSLPLELSGDATTDSPFRWISEELHRSDLVFGNLECPLSRRGRPMANDGCYAAAPEYASALAAASFRVVSLANNHCLDYGENAFLDTLDVLHANGVAVVGAGRSLGEARAPAKFDLAGTTVAILGYSMIGDPWVFAIDGECGVAPLNPRSVREDIDRIRNEVDLVILSVHWGHELRGMPFPRLIELGHYLIDSGADAVLGHHSHVPGSIEIHRGRPIFYSLGNFVFGHGHSTWGDNMLARLCIEDARISRLEIRGVRGTFQPSLLGENDVGRFHQRLDELSRPFGTDLQYGDGMSFLDLRP